MTKTYAKVGVQSPQVWLPKPGVDLTKWAVVACDQYTSEPDYWEEVEKLVDGSPSTLRLFLPEIYLGKPEEAGRIRQAQAAMQEYLKSGLLEPSEGMIYVERSVGGKTRHGLVLALDLEQYDYNKGAQSLIRATEGTIIERLPPRMRIREGALLELPHILVLIDDPGSTVIEPVGKAKQNLEKRYEFDLMMGSGHLAGYQVDPSLEARAIAALERLADPTSFSKKYGLGKDQPVLLFAMGDGNHSLATAKAVWEKIKPSTGLDHPARYALVEVENVHDDGLAFEPIHRALFGLKTDLLGSLKTFYGRGFDYTDARDFKEMKQHVDQAGQDGQVIGILSGKGSGLLTINEARSNLAVGSLQPFLDALIQSGQAEKIDYLHGDEVLRKLSSLAGNAGFYLPAMPKGDLFKTVILDGALPRKTFSMGEAHEKRFYMECRKIA